MHTHWFDAMHACISWKAPPLCLCMPHPESHSRRTESALMFFLWSPPPHTHLLLLHSILFVSQPLNYVSPKEITKREPFPLALCLHIRTRRKAIHP